MGNSLISSGHTASPPAHRAGPTSGRFRETAVVDTTGRVCHDVWFQSSALVSRTDGMKAQTNTKREGSPTKKSPHRSTRCGDLCLYVRNTEYGVYHTSRYDFLGTWERVDTYVQGNMILCGFRNAKTPKTKRHCGVHWLCAVCSVHAPLWASLLIQRHPAPKTKITPG